MPKDGSDLRKQVNDGEKKLLKIVDHRKAEIDKKIKSAVKKKSFATAASTRDGLYRSILTSYIGLNKDINKFLKTQSHEVAEYWYDKTATTLAEDGVKVATFGQFSKKYLNDINERLNPFETADRVLVSPRIGIMAQEDINAIRGIVTDTMREAATVGMTTPEMAQVMKSKVMDFDPSLVIRDSIGRKWKADSYFGMVNRTITAQVSRETTTDLMAEAGYDLIRVTGRSTDPNSPCIPYEGEILSTTGATPGYTTVDEAMANGLYHPNCIHGMTPVAPSEVEELKDN